MSKVTKIIAGVFGGMALLFALLGAGMRIGHSMYTRDFVPVEGTIISISRRYPDIEFSLNGQTAVYHSHSYKSWERVGDTVSLMVNPDDLQQVADDVLPMIGLVFTLVGVGMAIPAVCMIVFGKRSAEDRLRILSSGQRVTVTISDIRPNYNVTINHRHPIRLHATVRNPINGVTSDLGSHNLMRTKLQPGDQVNVYFDQMNEKKYIFDVSEDA